MAEEVQQWMRLYWPAVVLQSGNSAIFWTANGFITSSFLLPPPAKKGREKKRESPGLFLLFRLDSFCLFLEMRCEARCFFPPRTILLIHSLFLTLSVALLTFSTAFPSCCISLFLVTLHLRLVQRTLLEKNQEQPDVKGIRWEWEELSAEWRGKWINLSVKSYHSSCWMDASL